MSKTLNDTQRKLVEDNHNLIYSYIHSHKLNLDAVEDWYGAAAVGLCKAALIYDESRGCKFSTLAYLCIDNEVKMEMRRNRKLVAPTLSLHAPINQAVGCCMADIIPDNHDFMFSIYLNDAVAIATKGLSKRDSEFIHLIFEQGYTQKEVADKFGVSRTLVQRVYSSFKKKIRDYFAE